MKKIAIIPQGVCCDRITMDVGDDECIHNVCFEGGCDGNGKALGRLLEGMPAEKAAALLAGVSCDGKGTSCADQLSRGLIDRAAEKSKV